MKTKIKIQGWQKPEPQDGIATLGQERPRRRRMKVRVRSLNQRDHGTPEQRNVRHQRDAGTVTHSVTTRD